MPILFGSSLESYTSNNTTQHKTTRVQHDTTRVQHEITRVQHETARVQNNLKFVLIYSYHRSMFMLQNLET